jgi:adenylosuccinate synthase
LGVAPSKIGRVMGITKAYCTRVGAGPFPTELFDEDGEELQNKGNEFGSTTGRPRRCGWIDIPALKYTCMLNGVTELLVTKIDVLNDFEEVKVCEKYSVNGTLTDEIPFEYNSVEVQPQYAKYEGWKVDLKGIESYEALPEKLKEYVKTLENLVGVPVKAISISPDRKDVLFK